MRKMCSVFVAVAFALLCSSVFHPAILVAADDAGANAVVKAQAVAPTAPAPAAPEVVKPAEPAMNAGEKKPAAVVEDEGSDDVATIKAAAEKLKATDPELAKKLMDIAEGMDW